MVELRRICVPLFILAACAAGSESSARDGAQASQVTAFLHTSVVPMDSERVLRDHTVVVANGSIVALGPTSKVKIPAGATRIDAKGRYLIPALCDMHVHLVSAAWNIMQSPEARARQEDLPVEDLLFPYLANGVTTLQSLSATPEDLALRQRIERGELLGPRLILAPMVDGPRKAWPPPISTWVDSPAEAREAVRQAKAAGYDKIKAYSFLSPESYDAIIATAREVGMDVIGHVPMSLSVEHVLDSGQKLIAHSEELMKHAGGDYSAANIDRIAGLMADKGVWMTPTLMTSRSIVACFDNPDSLLARPETAYFRHPLERDIWSFILTKLYQPIPAESRDWLRRGFEQFQRPLTRAFHDRGGKLMTGSDVIIVGVVPGFSLHQELRELVDVGLTPFQALRTSTTAPFEYLGEGDRAGTISPGRRSDLVLVGANPLEDISAVSRVEGVMVRGRWLGAEEIRRRMKAVEALADAPDGSRALGGH